MDDTVLTYLDAYCERAGEAGLWAEPLNAVTNLFFIAAAIIAGRLMLRTQIGAKVDLWLLVFFLFLIGIGSGLWHMYATHHTMLMDVLPITLFINVYLVSALRRLFGFSWAKVAAGWGAYFALSMVAQKVLPPDMLNGTVMYLPTFLTLAILTVGLRMRDSVTAGIFRSVLLVWTGSLIFRTVDVEVCNWLPIGTHFLWHVLNAWVLYRLLKVLIDKAAIR